MTVHPQLVIERPRFYPVADHCSQWVAPPGPWGETSVRVARIEMRATETDTWPEYEPGQAPHFTFHFVHGRAQLRQHMPVGVPAHPGLFTPSTEIRIVGTTKADGPGMYAPMAPRWAREPVKDLWEWLNANWGSRIPAGWVLYKPVTTDNYALIRELMDL